MKHSPIKYLATVLLLIAFRQASGQEPSEFIVVDQFGYLPDSRKYAIVRDPQSGYDAAKSFSPGSQYALVNTETQEEVFTGIPQRWNNGATDPSSGDRVWHFDFSTVAQPGTYYVLDKQNNVRSFEFMISPAVYNEVLRQAVRAFYYQRAGHAKTVPYVKAAWADGASHLGSLQDPEARQYDQKNNADTEKDLRGGWYDAGDYNKYTNWTANYIVEFMKAYLETPHAFGDDYNIPESGNGISDLLDEAKYGLDFLLRMQQDNGAMLSIVGLASGSPPSTASGQSLYGTASTSASLNSAGAFALASKVYGSVGMDEYAGELLQSALHAWAWAEANPAVVFQNNDANSGTSGLGAGNQETDDYGRLMAKLEASVFLFEATGEEKFREFFDAHYSEAHLIAWNFAYPFETENQEALLYYTTVQNHTPAIAEDILDAYRLAMLSGAENLPAFTQVKDPYLAHLKDYTWGSNNIKSRKALMFLNMVKYGLESASSGEAALEYVHYLHGANPLNMVYLSNMYDYGAENSANEFYHTWFSEGTAWDRAGASEYGPAPGFVVGGPNPFYDWDGCCPDGCGSSANNALCTSESLSPPKDQPAQKSYKDFNTGWPVNSWSVTENSNGYQLSYIRLLAHYADNSYDCAGRKDGSAIIDACGNCAGGDTGIQPETDPNTCGPGQVTSVDANATSGLSVYPNPVTHTLYLSVREVDGQYTTELTDATGKILSVRKNAGHGEMDLAEYPQGMYYLKIYREQEVAVFRILKF